MADMKASQNHLTYAIAKSGRAVQEMGIALAVMEREPVTDQDKLTPEQNLNRYKSRILEALKYIEAVKVDLQNAHMHSV